MENTHTEIHIHTHKVTLMVFVVKLDSSMVYSIPINFPYFILIHFTSSGNYFLILKLSHSVFALVSSLYVIIRFIIIPYFHPNS